MCTGDPAMKIARREFTEEEKNLTGVIKREARRYQYRVFPLMEESKSTGIGLMNPTIR